MSRTATDTPARLSIPQCEPGLGTIVAAPTARGLIAGVEVAPVALWPDDRGVFFEVVRCGQGLSTRFDPATTQVSATFSYPGTIKAFHYHLLQADCWVPSMGMLQVALVDLREGSPTRGAKNTIYIGEHRPWQVLIPPGVAHGYKVIGDSRAGLIYVSSRFYDPADEGRLAHDDPRLGYDWTTRHK
jgi:dTDP-4-dehydrorhamnose 3,5-epimerase